jgi:hypothetical protein
LIEPGWVEVKFEVTKRNETFKMAEMDKLLNEEIDDRVTQNLWACYVKHEGNLQKEDCSKEIKT